MNRILPPRRQKQTEEMTFETFARREAEKDTRKRKARRARQIRRGEILGDGDDMEIRELVRKVRE